MFIPNLIFSIIILCIGWAIGAAIARVIAHFMKAIKFDEALQRAGFENFVKKAGLNLNSGVFLGSLVKYFVIVAFLIASFDVLGLKVVTDVLKGIVLGYLPNVIVGVLILLVGGVVGDVLSRIVNASARTASLSQANFLGAVSKWVVWTFALLVALDKVGVSGPIIQTLFTGFVVAVSLALGLSFGLGGQAAAARAIEKVSDKIASHK